MVKKCIYCKTSLDDNSVIDVCQRCGIGVWGERMFNAIVQNMNNAKESGDLYQGSVTSDPTPSKKASQKMSAPVSNSHAPASAKAIQSMAKEAIAFQEQHPKEDVFYDSPAIPTINNKSKTDILSSENEMVFSEKGSW